MSKNLQYDERMKRIDDALSLKEPDRVPIIPFPGTYVFTRYGYTMEEIMYDVKKARDGLKKYVLEYEPDMATNYSSFFAGQGDLLGKIGIKSLQWAGRPGVNINKNSIHQYIEKPYLGDEEYPELLSDISGWILNKYLPRNFTLMESFENLNFKSLLSWQSLAGTPQFINPQISEAFKILGEVGEKASEYFKGAAAFDREMVEMGFPVQRAASTGCAFDQLSDTLRGTIDTMADLYDQPENVKAAIEMFYPSTLNSALAQAKNSVGKFVFIPLHKGLDGFMSPKQYGEFYWPTLKRLIDDLIKAGCTPWVYTEGKYDSRLEFLKEIEDGKVMVHFEDVDMKEAKRIVGSHSCISGGFRSRILETGTKEEVAEAVKRLLDICMPGGGYIFDLADTLDEAAKPENVEVMFETVKTYGQY